MDEQSIFLRAIEKEPGHDRKAFLDEVCAGDASLRAGVESLLAAYESPDSFLASPFAERPDLAETSMSPRERPGSVIGPYKIREQIGEGGMGLVYVAEQTQPVRRKVALKVIKPGMDSRQVIARFEAERQALAMMDHPNIARVFDGGATESGRPYFVMEFVKGAPVTEYCNEHRLPLRERLRLFLAVCSAVQHAHQKGIIHRDIKPSNVMVASHDGVPVVKVIDFGVAKAIHQQLTDKTVYTHVAQFLGTPLYMSPEQAGHSSLDVDTRTDIYALGVLLYELLTGATPFDKERMGAASYEEIRRVIQEEEPPKPSDRVSTLAQADSTIMAQSKADVKTLSQTLRGELDWIVMKSLEKDRNRRYESASALGADVERYLKDEPVLACPPSRSYLIGKFLRRHRAGLMTVAAMFAATILFGFGIGWVVVDRAARHTRIEQAVAEDLKEVEQFCRLEQWANVRQSLERANGRIAGGGFDLLKAQIDARRHGLEIIADLDEARMKAVALPNDDNWHGGLIESDRAYATAFAKLDLNLTKTSNEAIAVKIRESGIRTQLLAALDHWIYVKDQLPKADAEQLCDIAKRTDESDWRKRLRSKDVANNRDALERLSDEKDTLDQPPANLLVLALRLQSVGAKAAQERLLRRAQQRYPTDFRLNFELGALLGFEKDSAGAGVGFLRAALVTQPQSPNVYTYLAAALSMQSLENESEAEAACRKAIELNPNYLVAYRRLGGSLIAQKRLNEAEGILLKAVSVAPMSSTEHLNYGVLCHDLRKHTEAESAFRRVVELHPKSSQGRIGLGLALSAQHKYQEAESEFRESLRLRWNEDGPKRGEAHFHLGMSLCEQHKYQEGEAEFRESLRLGFDEGRSKFCLSLTLLNQKKSPKEAEELARSVTTLDPPNNKAGLSLLGWALRIQDQLREAVSCYRKLVQLDPIEDEYFLAAFTAALAASGKGDASTLDEQQRSEIRQRSFEWLQAAIARCHKNIKETPESEHKDMRRFIHEWKTEVEYDGFRGAASLAKLPEADRREWQRFWDEVDAVEKLLAKSKSTRK